MRMTKIIVTVGPASCSTSTLIKMIREGADVMRINFSHGTLEEKEEYVKAIREAERIMRGYVPIIGDLQGPTFRIGDVDPFDVKHGDTVFLVNSSKGSAEDKVIPLPSARMYFMIEEGDLILLEGGRIKLRVDRVLDDRIRCTVLNDGCIKSRRTITIYGKEPKVPPITDKDVRDIEFAIEHGLEYIALSFVRSSYDIRLLKDILEDKGGDDIRVIAKIETRSAVSHLEEIVDASDVVLVARGDLGMYFDLAEIPKIQETVIECCIKKGKPVILATQLLESMVNSPMPTRAEVVDVMNAVKQGVDALMLADETSIGRYPVDSVRWLRKVIEEAEKDLDVEMENPEETIYDKFAKGVAFLASSIRGKVIAYTRGGTTPRRLARYRIKVPMYAVTSNLKVARQINLLWGIRPLFVEAKDYQEAWAKAIEELKRAGEISYGDILVYTTGLVEGSTDMVRIEIVR
ncbi:MAG: pyruvate kinase [Thermoprotei archaeon]|nr:MAG: pyruvate kinase [Thermoprotei archaeon]RLF25935.1 MAG: pyruvate kinase [Thermoprotei archaeon]